MQELRSIPIIQFPEYEKFLFEESQKMIKAHHDKVYGRGLTNPYQYFVNEDGAIIENMFGEVRQVGQIEKEDLEEIKRGNQPAFSIRTLAPVPQSPPYIIGRGSGKESVVTKVLRHYSDYLEKCEEKEVQPDISLEQVFGACIRGENQNNRKYDYDSFTMHCLNLNGVNRNGRRYYGEDTFDPYERGHLLFWFDTTDRMEKEELSLNNRYAALKFKVEIPKVKISIDKKRRNKNERLRKPFTFK